jgi:hypothetical protein
MIITGRKNKDVNEAGTDMDLKSQVAKIARHGEIENGLGVVFDKELCE